MRSLLLISTLVLAAAAIAQPAPPAKGMEVILLGTGYPAPDPERAGPATAVVVNGKYFLVDAGRAVTMRLAALKPRMPHVEAVFLTHLHSDHTEGLPDFFNTSWIMEHRAQPMELYGPEGSQEMVDGMLQFFAADIHIRRDLTEHQPAAGARVNVHIVREGAVYKDADVTITAFEVDHRPVVPAFGYKFESGGRTVVISGDTAPSANLVKFARGADVLVHEVYEPGAFGSTDSAAVANNLSRYHTDAEQVGRVAADAGVKKLVLTHIIRPQHGEQIRSLAAKTYKGPIVVGNDLTRIKVE
jgi:ribonuclease Z